MYFTMTPAHKTETGTANRWEITNSKPLGPIIMMGQSETTEQLSDHIYYTFVSSVTAPFYEPCKLCAFAEPKPFS